MMKRLFRFMLFTAMMAGGAVAASAQDPHSPGVPGGVPGSVPGMRMQQMQMPTFADLDKNKDGKLSREEFPSQMPQQFFDRMDENKDGLVEEQEWNNAMSRFRGAGGERMMAGPRFGESLTKFLDGNSDAKVSREEFARMAELFDRLDADKNGELSQEELNGFFRAVNEAQNQATGGVDVTRLVQNLDKNKDGKITADETDEKTFRNLDINKDGAVTKEEAEQALKKLAEQSKAKASQANSPKNQ